MEEANRFMELWRKLSWCMAGAISLLVLCPVPVLLLDIWSQKQYFGVYEEPALGPAILLVMVAIGVVVLILCGMQMSKYDYMEKERIMGLSCCSVWCHWQLSSSYGPVS